MNTDNPFGIAGYLGRWKVIMHWSITHQKLLTIIYVSIAICLGSYDLFFTDQPWPVRIFIFAAALLGSAFMYAAVKMIIGLQIRIHGPNKKFICNYTKFAFYFFAYGSIIGTTWALTLAANPRPLLFSFLVPASIAFSALEIYGKYWLPSDAGSKSEINSDQ